MYTEHKLREKKVYIVHLLKKKTYKPCILKRFYQKDTGKKQRQIIAKLTKAKF